MQIVIKPTGVAVCVYSEAIDIAALGTVNITRASHVEPDDQGRWGVDLSPVGGPQLGPFPFRSEALNAEHDWLERHWLASTS